MPFVNVNIVKGRTLEQKRNLVTSVTKAVAESIDVPEERVWVNINEMDTENFATGGQLIADKPK